MPDLWVTFCNFVCQFVVCGSSHVQCVCVMMVAEIRLKLHESRRERQTHGGSHTRRHSALQMSFCQSLWVDLRLTIQLRPLSLCGGFCVCWLYKTQFQTPASLKLMQANGQASSIILRGRTGERERSPEIFETGESPAGWKRRSDSNCGEA